MQAVIALDALGRALQAIEAGDPSGEARALLECAETARGNVDLADAYDIALMAESRAREAGAAEIEAAARMLSGQLLVHT
jgi:hypothetical protein